MPAHRANHPPRQLMVEIGSVKSLRATHWKPFGFRESREIAVDFRERFQIEVQRMSEFSQISDHALRVRIGNPITRGARGAVKYAHAPTGGVHVDKLPEPNRAVRVQLQRFAADHGLNG